MTPTPDELTKVLGVDPTSGGAWVNGSGLVWERISGTSVSGHIDAGPEHLTPWGVVHGGLYAMVAESAASVGASAAVLDRGQFAVGVDNVTDFLRPSSGGRLELVATPVIQGKSEQLWEVSVTRADGKPVARSRIRLRNVDLAPRTEPPRG
jgi:uncharacterized protein (TIGR00369 family)